MFEELLSFINVDAAVLEIVLNMAVIVIVTAVFAKIAGMLIGRYIRRLTKSIKTEQTRFIIINRLIILFIYIIGIVYAASLVPGFSSLGLSLLASAGVIGIVVGFAAQQAFSNIISGVFIAIFKPFSVGDRLEVSGDLCTVEDITLRHTMVNTWRNERIIIPNSKISEEYIKNFSIKDPKILGTLDVGISYDSDIDTARRMMLEEARKHPDILKVVKGEDNEFLRREDVIKVRLTELTDFSQNMRLYYWAPDKSAAVRIKFDLTESVKKRFDKAGIEIPFPYRTIVYKKDEEKKSAGRLAAKKR